MNMNVGDLKDSLLTKCKLIKNVKISKGILGGSLLFIKLDALDDKDWSNGIELNSIYFSFVYDEETKKLDLNTNGHVYLSNEDKQTDKYKYYAMKSIVGVHVDYGGKKFRKTSVKNPDDLVTKISTYVNAVMEDVVKYTGGYPYKRGL